MDSLKKINIGCGEDIKKGWINLDIADSEGVDVVWDINKIPLPFEDNVFDEVLCRDVLEHFDDYIPLLREIKRILKPGGIVTICVPHFTSKNNFEDPTHKRLFSVKTFDFFVKGHSYHEHSAYQWLPSFTRIKTLKVTFAFCKNLGKMFTKTPYRTSLYESTILRNILPAESIWVELIK